MAAIRQVIFLIYMATVGILASPDSSHQQLLEESGDDEGRRLIAELMLSVMGLPPPASSDSSIISEAEGNSKSRPIPPYVVELGRSLTHRKGELTATGAELDAELVEKGAAASVFVAGNAS